MSDPAARPDDPDPPAPPAAQPALQPIADAIHKQLAAERRKAARAAARAQREADEQADIDYLLGCARRQGVVAMRKVAKASGAAAAVVERVVEQLRQEALAAQAEAQAEGPFDPSAMAGGGRPSGAPEKDIVPSKRDPDPDATEWKKEKNPIRKLPDDCPVIPIGASGEVYYYLKPRRELLGVKKHDADTLRKIFGDRVDWLWANFPKFNEQKGTQSGWKADRAAESLMHACDVRPPFDPLHTIREAGGWDDGKGGLILHCGDRILVQGEWREPGLFGDLVYPRGPALPRPLEGGEPGALVDRLTELFDTWTWAAAAEEGAVGLGDRPLSDGPKLATLIVLGWMMAAIGGAALHYRPIVWVTGDAGSGKSALLDAIQLALGRGLLKSGNPTAAGIYQTTGRSCVAVAIDEAENDPRGSRMRQMVELARNATYGDTGLRGSDKQTASSFEIRSAFLFSSILIPPQLPQDVSRTAVLDLGKVPGGASLDLDREFLATAGQALRRRLVDGWARLKPTRDLYAAALIARGHNQRSVDQWGTLLTLADLALYERLPDPDMVSILADALARDRIDKSTYVVSNAEAMLNHLISVPLTVFRGGTQMTIGQLVAYGAGLHESEHGSPSSCRDALEPWGVYVKGWRDEARVAVPNQHAGLLRIFADTVWRGEPGASGAWSQAMKRLPQVVAENSRRLGGRGWSVPVTVFLQEDDADRARRAADPSKKSAQQKTVEPWG